MDNVTIKFAWIPIQVRTEEWDNGFSGSWKYKWIWLEHYFFFHDKNLDLNYVYHLSLPSGMTYCGIEKNPFVKFE